MDEAGEKEYLFDGGEGRSGRDEPDKCVPENTLWAREPVDDAPDDVEIRVHKDGVVHYQLNRREPGMSARFISNSTIRHSNTTATGSKKEHSYEANITTTMSSHAKNTPKGRIANVPVQPALIIEVLHPAWVLVRFSPAPGGIREDADHGDVRSHLLPYGVA